MNGGNAMCEFYKNGFCEDRSLTDFVPCAKENCPFWEKATAIINETHELMAEQRNILNKTFSTWETISVPSAGWTLEEMKQNVSEMKRSGNTIVFVSPIPFMLKELAKDANVNVLVFHNDNRKKKELPNGKIIQVVAETGWQLV
jgi:hypothetical protein